MCDTVLTTYVDDNNKKKHVKINYLSSFAANTIAVVQRNSNSEHFRSKHHSWFTNSGDNGVYETYYRFCNLKPTYSSIQHNDTSAYVA